jgi:uncharacterized protein
MMDMRAKLSIPFSAHCEGKGRWRMAANRIQPIEQFVRNVMAHPVHPAMMVAHEFEHVDRVRRWALHIAHNEGFPDQDVVEAAALLHDVGLAVVAERRQHASVGAEMATQFLHGLQLFTDREIEAITEAIRHHSALEGAGQLGAILRDADMLDMFGAVGIMRAFTSKYNLPPYDPANVRGETWNLSAADFTHRFSAGTGVGSHIVDQINFQISCYSNLQTTTARRIAKPLIAFMQAFLAQLEAESNRQQSR